MTKKNGKNRERRAQNNQDGGQAPQPIEGAPVTHRKKLTVPERLIAKSSNAHELVKSVANMTAFYGAGSEIVAATQNLLVEIDIWRGSIKTLVDEGWQPVVKGKLKDLEVGDKISIAKDSKDLYPFIPVEARLVVGKIERSKNNRIRSILLIDERSLGDCIPEGISAAYGWAQLSHIDRR